MGPLEGVAYSDIYEVRRFFAFLGIVKLAYGRRLLFFIVPENKSLLGRTGSNFFSERATDAAPPTVLTPGSLRLDASWLAEGAAAAFYIFSLIPVTSLGPISGITIAGGASTSWRSVMISIIGHCWWLFPVFVGGRRSSRTQSARHMAKAGRMCGVRLDDHERLICHRRSCLFRIADGLGDTRALFF